MTLLPPGLIAPSDRTRTVVRLEVPAPRADRTAPRWTAWSIVFVLLVALTVLAVGLAAVDVLSG